MQPKPTDIRVVIADDHPIFRKGLRQILGSDRDLMIVGEAADGEQALSVIQTYSPHVAVLDVDMPRKNGLAVASEVRALGLEVAIMFLTMHKNERFFNAALDAGVRGYLLKQHATADIIDGVKAVAEGRSYVAPALSAYVINRHRANIAGKLDLTGAHALLQFATSTRARSSVQRRAWSAGTSRSVRLAKMRSDAGRGR